jgi:hypothetical protein
MIDIWLFHPKKILKFYTFYSKEIFLGAFWLHAALKIKKTLLLMIL